MRERVAVLRHQGYGGVTIMGHRAFRTLPLRPWTLIHSAVAAFVLTILWLIAAPYVGRFWAATFETWFDLLGLQGTIAVIETQGRFFNTAMPRVTIAAAPPGTILLIAVGFLTAAGLLMSFLLKAALTPVSYLLRAFCFIQATAVFYFAFFTPYFPHDLPGYISTMLGSSMAFITALPAIMSFTFYIFDVTLVRKLQMTFLVMLHLVILAPLQYLVHVFLIVKLSTLFMPVLYIMFGLLPQIGIFIAFYSWGMSRPGWQDDHPW
jgi:hypothetical protein